MTYYTIPALHHDQHAVMSHMLIGIFTKNVNFYYSVHINYD